MIVNIIDREFNFIGQVDAYESYLSTKKYSGVGTFELHLPSTALYADDLVEERIIFTDENKAFVVLYRKRESETNKLEVKGLELKSFLSRMLVFPPVAQANYRINNNAETIMKEYVQATLDRKNITNIEVAPNKNRGDKMVYQSRYKNLADELEKISKASGLGWDITLDMDKKKFVFDVVEGRDITVNQDVLPPAIFSVDYDNVGRQGLERSRLDYANTAIVAGQGEGADRAIEIVGGTDGLDSIETFVDANDIEDAADLPSRGSQKLKESEEILVFDSEVLTDKNLIYEEDYKLGDISTIQNKDWDVSVNRRITEITEIYEASGFRLDVAFGENMPTLSDKIRMMTDSPIVEGGGDGDQGPSGEVGPVGPRGPQGEQGPQGIQGIQGEIGPIGKTGLKGDTGDVGPKGEQGIQGLIGETGEKGDIGPEGPEGIQGFKGDTGERGPQGEKGIKGDTGPRGPKGDSVADSVEWSGVLNKPVMTKTLTSTTEPALSTGDQWHKEY